MIGSFTDTFGLFFNEDEYKQKKETAVKKIGGDLRLEKSGVRMCIGIKALRKKKWNDNEIAKLFELKSGHSVRYYLKRYGFDDPEEQISEKLAFEG